MIKIIKRANIIASATKVVRPCRCRICTDARLSVNVESNLRNEWTRLKNETIQNELSGVKAFFGLTN